MELTNFPFVNQLSSLTLDGRPDENRLYNCVPASICAGLRYFTGRNDIEPDQLKDQAYGEWWVNSGTAASAFVGLCAQYGVQLYAVENGSASQAISDAHALLARGLPVIFTQQDDYASDPSFTHVCVWYKDTATSLTAMDPFGAKALTYSDDVWAARLRSTELWTMEKMMIIDLETAGVSQFFKATTNGMWLCMNGKVIGGGILSFYQQFGGSGLCGLTYLGLPESNEIGLNLTGHPEIVVQKFERAYVCYDPAHIVDFPPGAGSVYLTHHPVDASDVQQELDAATMQITSLQHKIDAATAALK